MGNYIVYVSKYDKLMNSTGKIKFEVLYKIYSKDLFRYSYSILRNRFDAEDAVQETFRKYIEKDSRFRRDCSIKTWLMTLARNHCYDVIRKRTIKNESDDYKEPAYRADNLDLRVSLEEAFMKLNPEETELIYLRDKAGYSYAEIAGLLSISVENVKIKLYRTRRKLREILSEN